MARIEKCSLIIMLLLLISLNAFSQCAVDPNNPDIPIDEDDPTCQVPLDTWVYVLVLAAAIFGAYQLYKKQKATLS
ncbi:hypothetical protein [Mucilaginibacter glaciei]|uniref:Signal peptidase n=1 Tax=Mucilaginibacter glaciei TaxID=2772109 RepID=A0A926NJ59_9SPHI|nr:hypothetical protein [Mucilaginibacter glaciei]MBD1393059.1 hypothetical protein [Mucilaginibacter glaciei]